MPTSLNPFRTLLQHRNFRLFWMGQTLSLIGTWMQTMAQGWLALELTNNAFYVGLVATVTSLPILAFSLHAGVLVDRREKLRLVKWGQVLFCLQAAVLWWVTWTGRVNIAWLLLLATANGLINAFEIPARQSLVIDLVGRDDLPGAIALNSSGFNLARVVGPSIGALIIAQFGIAWCFGVNAISYVAVLIGLYMIRLPAWSPPQIMTSPGESILEGIRYMRRTPKVAGLMALVTVYSVLGVPYLTLMPVVAKQQLGLGAAGYGGLLACVGIGGLAGALTLAAIGERVRRGLVLSVSSLSYAVLLIVFSLIRIPHVAYPLLLMIGFAMIMNGAVANATLQHLSPNELRGRMMAAYSFVVVGLSQVVGSFVSGVIAGFVGASWAIGGAAAIMLVFAYAALVRRPELRAL